MDFMLNLFCRKFWKLLFFSTPDNFLIFFGNCLSRKILPGRRGVVRCPGSLQKTPGEKVPGSIPAQYILLDIDSNEDDEHEEDHKDDEDDENDER